MFKFMSLMTKIRMFNLFLTSGHCFRKSLMNIFCFFENLKKTKKKKRPLYRNKSLV